MGNVVISPNINKERVRIDPNGNIINKDTKQIIERNEDNIQQSQQVQSPQPSQSSPLTIQQQIDEAKANLIKLEELKKLKIQQMKAELELLEK